ncbi:MAG: Gamma-glutamyltranspeptidase [Labilithrix sp.]|nr:Gamma-glutamyltranspeptidase [Labilithrix sp.]
MRISSDGSLTQEVLGLLGKRRTRRAAGLVALVVGVVGVHVAAFPEAHASYTPSAEGQSAAVATDHSDATRAALEVMAHGGNAADGAVAAALALGVVSPSASGMGGGGFALVYEAATGKVTALDFRETSPASFSSDVVWPKPKAGSKAPDRFGWSGPRGGAVGVPGEPAGLELLARRFGKRSLAADAAPAVALADRGFFLSRHTAEQVAVFADRVAVLPTFGSAFLTGGRPSVLGTRVRRPELAATLTRYGAAGGRAIYEGPVAQKIVDASRAAQGSLTLGDLAGYAVKERAPLSRTLGGRTVYTMPAPSAGGLALLEVLTMYGATRSSSLASLGFGSSAYLHAVAEALRGSFADRARIAGDPDLDPAVAKAFDAALEPAQLAARRARIEPMRTHAPLDFRTREQGTSHVVVADAAGNVVTLTSTVNGPFGSGVVAGDTGLLLNNELDDFTTAEDAASFGLEGGGPNRPRPRARPVSSMTPTLVIENGLPILALGGSGGTRIATGVVQAALARLVFDLDPNACVSHPRIHTQGPLLLVDPEIPNDVRDGLRGRGETVRDETFTGSGIQMIAWQRAAGAPVKLLAAADPRKGGLAAAR